MDIDGTLGDYHEHFQWFLSTIYCQKMTEWNGSAHWPGTSEFSEALGMEKGLYRAAKLAYRLGGLKRCLPLFGMDLEKGGHTVVREEIQYLRSQGIQVWICTQRPWLALTTVDSDTQYWIDNNIGKIDGLIYGEDKYADLIDIVGYDRVLGVVDDLPECLDRARELGLRTAARRIAHNYSWLNAEAQDGIEQFRRIKDMSTIIDGWMETHNG
jgi:hypothetical protein